MSTYTTSTNMNREEVKRLHERGYTQSEIAEKLGVTQSGVSRFMEREGIEARHVSEYDTLGPEPLPDEELLDDIIVGSIAKGEWLSSHEYDVYGTHSFDAIIRHFDSWENALRQAQRRYEEEWDE